MLSKTAHPKRMATITVRNLDASVKRRLRMQAADCKHMPRKPAIE
ncbi:MAG: FitA-like ribbon-helix-helix domain-containing protein [Spirochaetota bacterium]